MTDVRALAEIHYTAIINLLAESPINLDKYFDFSELFDRCLEKATNDLAAKAENIANELKYEGILYGQD